jgi:hypothetical protein
MGTKFRIINRVTVSGAIVSGKWASFYSLVTTKMIIVIENSLENYG